LWQVPLVFCAALIACRLARGAGVRLQHRVWVGALFLEALLPFCQLRLDELGRQAWGLLLWFRPANSAGGHTQVVVNAGLASQVLMPARTAEILAAIVVLYLGGMLYFASRLVWGLWTTDALRRRAQPLGGNADSTDRLARFEEQFGLGRRSVTLATTSRFHGPATVGLRRATLLLPVGFAEQLSPGEFDALLAHEFAHVQRWDFAKNLLYGIVTLPIAYHPLLWLTCRRIAETRELVCDAMAAEAVGGRDDYARSLLRLASMIAFNADQASLRILHAIGIFDAHIFERRVMQLTGKKVEIRGVQRLAVGVGCAVIALATCASALALRMDVNQPSTQSSNPKSVAVKPDLLKLVTKVQPVYPVEAKKKRIQGRVVLDAVIGKQGEIENLRVVSGPPELQKAALEAVKQWSYEPYLLNGAPVEVTTKINITFTLAK